MAKIKSRIKYLLALIPVFNIGFVSAQESEQPSSSGSSSSASGAASSDSETIGAWPTRCRQAPAAAGFAGPGPRTGDFTEALLRFCPTALGYGASG